MVFKSGFITIIGRPNVGKSTLLNAISGEKIAITSDKPQTTRNTIRAIVNRGNSQMVFIDTPGMHKPKNKLGEYMVKVAKGAISEVDVVLFIVEATDTGIGAGDLHIVEQLKDLRTPVFLIINKIDLVHKEYVLPLINSFKDKMEFHTVIPISALSGDGIDILQDEIGKVLPEGPLYFPEDIITDQPEKQIVAEFIREQVLNLTHDEIPHGIGIEVISFKERPEKKLVEIQANIYCEKESHKGILIGRNGSMLKEIGTLARKEIENLLGLKVFLELWIKVKPGWRNSETVLRTLGYTGNKS